MKKNVIFYCVAKSSGRPPTLAYIWYYLSSDPKGVSYIGSGINHVVFQKVAYVCVVPRTSAVLFTKRTSSGPYTYVHAKNSGICPLDLA
jgi:hypothetical protein